MLSKYKWGYKSLPFITSGIDEGKIESGVDLLKPQYLFDSKTKITEIEPFVYIKNKLVHKSFLSFAYK